MRTPQYRYGVHPFGGQWPRSSMIVQVHRVDGSPSHDRRGERLHQHGVTLDEMIADLRAAAARLRAMDDFEDDPKQISAGPFLEKLDMLNDHGRTIDQPLLDAPRSQLGASKNLPLRRGFDATGSAAEIWMI